MRNYKLIGLVLLTLFLSCSDDFLEKNPLDQVSSETFWKSEADAHTALVGVYNSMQASIFSVTRYNLDCLTDNGHNRTNANQVMSISRGDLLPATGGIVNSIYNDAYKGISACNIFLKNITDIEMNASVREQYIAEVKFIRAWYYFNLQQFFGDVVIYDTPPTVEESKIKQSSSQNVLEFIHSDLDDAIASLPNTPYTGNIVKNTALALKAKVHLHNKEWSQAADLTSQIMISGTTSLSDDFTGLFITSGQEANPDEILFSVKFLAPDNYHSYQIYVGWWSEPNPRQELVDIYESVDGISISQSPLYNPLSPFENRDPRLLQTIQVEPWFIDGNEIQQETTNTGYRIQKGIDKNIGPLGYDTLSDMDIIHLRFADVLLMYAEAQNEAVGPDQSVYNAINAVRSRSNMPDLPVQLSKDEMRERIRLERRVELAFEGHHYLDLKRWGVIEDALSKVDEPGLGIGGLKFKSHHYNWPFPQSEIDRNPELDQKDGY
ncbi:RagB/SusD family nutrient uptake outer membrane protein [Arenibacter certesii]|uniref:Membrane protein n=1 Tax=Arenibacter certesii TaxID=228955 RepID=A0A918MPB1_9FLAO|nr:RagB/SusD family nutrient uptake outer membrane protein [Arenibacter certesii]GGW42116.1 membrane protein [Arenibacter certesii]